MTIASRPVRIASLSRICAHTTCANGIYRGMSNDPMVRIAKRQNWLAPIEQPVQNAVHAAFHSLGESGPAVRNALHGTWLHEPLHAAITDVPVGAWTAAVVFDALAAFGADNALNKAADASVMVGLVGAVGSAVTGINDWADTSGTPRRVGMVHALLNVAATSLFAGSCLARRKRNCRSTARSLAAIGYVLASISAHLGGSLVYEYGIGVQDRKPLT